MKEKLRSLGLDVHAVTIAVAEPEGEVWNLGTIPNRAESIRKLIKTLGPADQLRACYASWSAPIRHRFRAHTRSSHI